MSNIIAVIWDFDMTLVNGYMQDPIFEHYHVNPKEFWTEVKAMPELYKNQAFRVNPDTIYLSKFIHEADGGLFDGLNNEKLKSFGKLLKFFDGIPEIFDMLKQHIENEKTYKKFDIKVEHYIISTGMGEIIRGSIINRFVAGIWGCELIEKERADGSRVISETVYTIDNTTKTRALFEINKGVGQQDGVEVNTSIPKASRRVPFENMIYIADGPSDVPAFSLTKQQNGSTFAIYPKGNIKALQQVEQLRKDGRLDMYAEADYSEGTTAYMWLDNKIHEIADRIVDQEKSRLRKTTSAVPKHLV